MSLNLALLLNHFDIKFLDQLHKVTENKKDLWSINIAALLKMISKQSGFNFSLNLMASIIVVQFCFLFLFFGKQTPERFQRETTSSSYYYAGRTPTQRCYKESDRHDKKI